MKLNWGWLLALGTAFVLLGIIALVMPVASSVGVTFSIAAILLASGVVQFIHGYQQRHDHGAATRFLQSLLAFFAGGLMFRYPEGGMMGVALLLSFYFFIEGAAQWLLYLGIRETKGSGWAIASSLASFFMGVFIVATFPWSALWVPGTLLGINLITSGAAMIGLGYCIHPRSHPQGHGPEVTA